ncbi:MAG: hypothetical protein K8R68_07610 [Bacteroidales bacterium]|nr:hypothetical protein [Bacteroidales bacterium]
MTQDKKIGKYKKNWGLVLKVFVIGIVCIIVGAWIILDFQISNSEKFCENLIPEIESYYQVHKVFPASLSDLQLPSQKLPERLKDTQFYISNGLKYRFIVPSKGPIAGSSVYNSEDKEWEFIQEAQDINLKNL